MPTPSLSVIHQSDSFCLATWGRVQISCWRHRIEQSELQSMMVNSRRMLARLDGEKIITLTLLDTSVKLPDDAVRKLGSEMMVSIAPRQQASATVIAGDGFLASAARAAFAGMVMLARTPMPQKSFATVDDASRWLSGIAPFDRDHTEKLIEAATTVQKTVLHTARG